ncbi:uncharacterized protein LOC129953839 [Eupeodes corollae]|uniref:uncharacterized protein LOC129953839 n=1 Tax=Eupeodes corollae TaxID=290404 RepID=UPI0024925324|nr:uncharacterized protein LOC129953839 [Eupeodes corollae]XP_055923308.1 uncharacterized protein LOC129953839 [Eupeodes corollae]
MNSFEALVPEQDLCLSVEEREFIPMYMANVLKIEYEGLDKTEIEKISGMLVFRLTTLQVNFAASITKQQSKCHYWHKLRIGGITASVFKQAARTNLKNVSMSLLKSICYFQDEIHSVAVTYGCRHESEAVNFILFEEKEQHTQLTIETSGIIIDKEKSYYACSPDGIWRCDCCGEMPVEVKCPFCLKDGDVATFLSSSSCPIIKENGEWRISKQHQYYWQIQMQCAILKSDYCIFCIYSPFFKGILKVPFDKLFFDSEVLKTDLYFKNIVLRELLARYYSNRTNLINIPTSSFIHIHTYIRTFIYVIKKAVNF